MSLALYARRLYWDGEHGCAKTPGFFKSFSTYPKIKGLPFFDSVDFAPEVGTALIVPHRSVEREMTRAETVATNVYLDALADKE